MLAPTHAEITRLELEIEALMAEAVRLACPFCEDGHVQWLAEYAQSCLPDVSGGEDEHPHRRSNH